MAECKPLLLTLHSCGGLATTQLNTFKLLKFKLPQEGTRERPCDSAAERGDADAQLQLFARYSSGLDVERNTKLASTWLQKAADQDRAVRSFPFLSRLAQAVTANVL